MNQTQALGPGAIRVAGEVEQAVLDGLHMLGGPVPDITRRIVHGTIRTTIERMIEAGLVVDPA